MCVKDRIGAIANGYVVIQTTLPRDALPATKRLKLSGGR